ncbi:succinate dehydrogenase, cytochrome b556 subunit [Methylobacterium gnaphalii]|uniref:Succinate dehydrogenase cytochrome b556 subunit n=1 Tax=Methylobacterium gnaphalii TaxID=1010610 RepID=A0A512JKA4_9HYPH|nr:succinate dehydrogenase, cytochrome b556 subunit [Methylobacterium gnaphalii]GEP10302.1 succinate dehydrogenase, cytochrome b556 subunit [Methylobacterium gnaphalii]GJD70949.1 Succinate dehydrogenase cytochrome b556 subunit [Methylobacterium gnaphalii]GLS49757.1 succinate dehydrogenase, cytochrome b556 subunit [Methylobacterium gnaphalii]
MAPIARPNVAQPLSPHLQIYRWTWTMAMSVFHRITGTALYGGTALVAIWLVALASGPRAYGAVAWFFGSWIGLLILFAYTWVLLHHMLGGLRHFVWDTGYGYDKPKRLGLARATLIGSVTLTLVIWLLAVVLR